MSHAALIEIEHVMKVYALGEVEVRALDDVSLRRDAVPRDRPSGSAMPDGILAFQRGVLRWQAWLAAYHASLVDAYPPFALDTSPAAARTAAA